MPRRHDIDALRVFAFALLILYHCAMLYVADWDFHLRLACFKVAVIAAGIDHRRRAGAGAGPGFDTAGEAVEPYLTLACSGTP